MSARRPASFPALLVIAVLLGLAMGALTSVLQKYLDSPWLSLVNSASPWLTPAFIVGAMQRRIRGAVTAGITVCVFELVGYYVTASVRGFPAGHAILVFWTACAVVGGPIFGIAGHLWWSSGRRRAAIGAAVLAAAFVAEGLVSYEWRLHYGSSAALFCVIGACAVVALGLRRHHVLAVAWWTLVVLPVGLFGEWILGLVYDQRF